MRRVFLVSLALCGCFLLGAESLLKNGDFEGREPYPWIFWPQRQKVVQEWPSGNRCLLVEASEASQQVIQRPLPVTGGCAYDVRMRVRAELPESAVSVSLIFRDGGGRTLSSEQVLTCRPTASWCEATGTAIAPEGASSAELVMVFPAGCKVSVDDVSLQSQEKVLGTFDGVSIRRLPNGDLRIEQGEFILILARLRNYAVRRIQVGASERMSYLFCNLASQQGKGSSNEFYSGYCVEHLTLERRDGTLAFVVRERHPLGVVMRTLEFFPGQPYMRVCYELTATTDYQSQRFLLNLGFPASMKVLVSQPEKELVYLRKGEASWFNVQRPEQHRFLGYFNDGAREGMGVIGADSTNWNLLPGGLLSSSGKAGGYTLELNRWVRRPVRRGDQLYLELFLAPVDTVEQLQDLTKTLSN